MNVRPQPLTTRPRWGQITGGLYLWVAGNWGAGHLQSSVLRLMPREEMRDAKVDGFMPSNSAAPPGPETLPLVCFRAFIIVSRSCRFNSFRVRSAGSAAG